MLNSTTWITRTPVSEIGSNKTIRIPYLVNTEDVFQDFPRNEPSFADLITPKNKKCYITKTPIIKKLILFVALNISKNIISWDW